MFCVILPKFLHLIASLPLFQQILNCCALSSSDADATYFELEQAVLEESLQSFQNNEEGKKRSATTTSAKRKQEVVESAVGAGTRSDALNTDVYQDSVRLSAAAAVRQVAPSPMDCDMI